MPIIDTPAGTLEVTNAILSASEFRGTQKISVSNSAPTKNFSVGDKFHVSTTDADAVNITGNLVAQKLKIGNLLVSPTFDLAAVSNVGNTTSNTLQFANATTGFTTTANVEIGGNITLTSNAQVKVGSNVLAEYTGPHGREPKEMPLKKFPEIAFDASKLDGNDTTNTYTQAGYTVTASSSLYASLGFYPWKVFDGTIIADNTYHGWHSGGNPSTVSGSPYNTIDSSYVGEWIKLELPKAIKLDHFTIAPRDGYAFRQAPKDFKVYGSNNDSTWVELVEVTNATVYTDKQFNTTNVTTSDYYKYFALVIQDRVISGGAVAISGWELYGTEEPAPPGDLSLDTTLKSTFNSVRSNNYVMYFDGDGFIPGDNTSNNLVTGSNKSVIHHNATYDSTGKYWTLDGSTESNVTTGSLGLVGDAPHTVSTWINASNVEDKKIFSIGSGYSEEIVRVDDTQIAANTWHNVTYAYQGEGGSKVTYVDGRKVEEAQVEDTFGDYPPFAMTDYETGGYRVSASSEYSATYVAWEAFDDDITDNTHAWISGNLVYNQTTGSYNGNANLGAGVADNGEWIKIEMPHKLVLDYITICGDDNTIVNPKDWKIYGSNDDQNWDVLLSKTNALVVGRTATSGKEHTVNATKAYKYFALVVTKSGGYTSGNHYIQVSELQYYGHKEGDLTRFPEPTRVLKYPHVAMTGPAQRGYVAKVSSQTSTTVDYPHRIFDGDDTTQFRSAVNTYTSGTANTTDNLKTQTSAGGTATINGSWVSIELPHKLILQSTRVVSNDGTSHVPERLIIYGSNDITNDGWTEVDTTYKSADANIPYAGTGKTWTTTASSTGYKNFALAVSQIESGTGNNRLVVSTWELYGVQEDTGTPAIVGGPFAGKVANFRVYDQYLGDERIQEIYDAQKDAFGHKKSSMTLYKGRVGVGTTEPEGALTVIDEPHALAKFPARAVSANDSYVEGDGQIKLSAADGSGYQAFDGLTSTSWTATPTRNTRLSEEVDFGAWLKIQTPESMSLKKAEIESNPYWAQVGATFQGVGVGHALGDTVACNKDGTRIAIAETAGGGTITAAQDGRVRIYDWNGSAWTQVGQNLTGTQSDYYGAGNMGFSDDGSRFITSSPNDGTSGGATPNAGVVEVYYLSGSTWTILGTPFTSSDGDAQVGKSCAISGDGNTIAFVEFQYDDTNVGVNAGRTRVFTWNGTTWVQKGSDMIGDVTGDGMGRVMEMTGDGNYIIIGNYSAGSNNGKVWVYAWDGSDWVKRGNTLVGTGADLLGFDVTISDDANTIAIGENHNDVIGIEAGAVEIRTWNGSAYVLTQTLYDPEATSGRFGSGVALSGDGTRLVAVTHHYPAGSGSAHGRARVFEYNGTSWELRIPDASIGAIGNQGTDGSGSALGQEDGLAISRDGSVIVVGLKNDDTSGNANSGQAKVFNMPSNIKSIWGSNDDVNWTKITTGNQTFRGDDRLEFKNLDNPNYYKYHAIVADAFTQLKDVKLFGVRNQGSSTLHDGTLTLTKKVTAPQLESTGIINMKGDYTEIRANSNVVTEFPRSKKFMKFPRVALTAATTGGYTASASSEFTSAGPYNAWEAFDGITGGTSYWSTNSGTYTTSNPPTLSYTGTTFATNVEGVNKYGEWLQIEFPHKVKYSYSTILAPTDHEERVPRDGYIVGSNDLAGQWTTLHRFEDVTRTTTTETVTYTPPSAPTQFFKYFRLVIEALTTGGANFAGVDQWELFGVPEYDPEAHGVDVVVKSVPNVPNTDWLEVYYDAKDLVDGAVSTVNDLKPTGTANNGVANGNLSVSDGAFTFDGSGDYISSTVTTTTGAFTHTFAFWMNIPSSASTASSLVGFGTSSSDEASVIRFDGAEKFRWYFWGNDIKFTTPNVRDKWVHVVGTYDGGNDSGLTVGNVGVNRKIFINTKETTVIENVGGSAGSDALNLLSTSYAFRVGSDLSNGNTLSGKIANVRLFNRALTSDEIYQLYAYQKEYFGHGALGMTLKAGRLGIGTSEPRAMLQVGDEPFGAGSRPIFRALNDSSSTLSYDATEGTKIFTNEFNSAHINVTNSYSTSSGRFTAPISGYYYFEFQILVAVPNAHYGTVNLTFYKNGTNVNRASSTRGLGYTWINNNTGATGDHSTLDTPTVHAIFYLTRGEYVQCGYISVGSSTASTSYDYSKNYGFFHGYLLST